MSQIYSSISVEKKYSDILEKIVKVGLAQYYKPMPNDVKEKWSWRHDNWGTMLGCYENELHDGSYTYTTAWSPVSDDIIQKLLHEIPTFVYVWEDEQGFGCEYIYTDGQLESSFEWDLPEWEQVSDGVTRLVSDYRNLEGLFTKGLYRDYNIYDYIGDEE